MSLSPSSPDTPNMLDASSDGSNHDNSKDSSPISPIVETSKPVNTSSISFASGTSTIFEDYEQMEFGPYSFQNIVAQDKNVEKKTETLSLFSGANVSKNIEGILPSKELAKKETDFQFNVESDDKLTFSFGTPESTKPSGFTSGTDNIQASAFSFDQGKGITGFSFGQDMTAKNSDPSLGTTIGGTSFKFGEVSAMKASTSNINTSSFTFGDGNFSSSKFDNKEKASFEFRENNEHTDLQGKEKQSKMPPLEFEKKAITPTIPSDTMETTSTTISEMSNAFSFGAGNQTSRSSAFNFLTKDDQFTSEFNVGRSEDNSGFKFDVNPPQTSLHTVSGTETTMDIPIFENIDTDNRIKPSSLGSITEEMVEDSESDEDMDAYEEVNISTRAEEATKFEFSLIHQFHEVLLTLHYSLETLQLNEGMVGQSLPHQEKQQLLCVAATEYANILNTQMNSTLNTDEISYLKDQKCLILLIQAMYLTDQFALVPLLTNWVRCYSESWSDNVFEFALKDDIPSLLKYISTSNLEEYTPEVCELIASKPILEPRSSFTDYNIQFSKWQSRCKKSLPSLTGDAKDLFNIFIGNIQAIRSKATKWYDELIGRLLYTKPTCTRDEFLYIVREVYGEHNSRNLTALDEILYNIMDIYETESFANSIEDIVSAYGSFFTFSILDLLWHADVLIKGALFNYPRNEGLNLRERMLKECIRQMRKHPSSLWKIAMDFASTSAKTKESMMKDILSEITPNSEKQMQQIESYCRNFTFLQEQLNSLRKRFAEIYIENHLYAQGVYHLLKAGDEKASAEIIDKLLDVIVRQESSNAMTDDRTDTKESMFQSLKEIAEMIQIRYTFDGSVYSERLAFIGQYFKMLELLELNDLKGAANIITTLVSRDNRLRVAPAPRKFWIILFSHALPLLENDSQVIFSSKQTDILIDACEELCVSHRRTEYMGQLEDDWNIIRLALTRNLTRVILEDDEF